MNKTGLDSVEHSGQNYTTFIIKINNNILYELSYCIIIQFNNNNLINHAGLNYNIKVVSYLKAKKKSLLGHF